MIDNKLAAQYVAALHGCFADIARAQEENPRLRDADVTSVSLRKINSRHDGPMVYAIAKVSLTFHGSASDAEARAAFEAMEPRKAY